MKEEVKKRIENGKYTMISAEAGAEVIKNKADGWLLFPLGDGILFSHQAKDYNQEELPEILHAHGYYELTLIASDGNVEYIAEGQNIFLHHGMAVLSKPNHFHMFRLPCAMRYERFVVYFKHPSALYSNPCIMRFIESADNSLAIFDFSDTSLLQKLYAISEDLHTSSDEHSRARAYLSLGEVFLALNSLGFAKSSCCTEISIPKFVVELKAFVDANFASISSVDTIAEKFFYSREYISRSFKKYYNTPLYKYILSKKLLLCRTLLRNGDSVESAARRSGFSNMSSFVKLFKKHTGMTPSEYRTHR